MVGARRGTGDIIRFVFLPRLVINTVSVGAVSVRETSLDSGASCDVAPGWDSRIHHTRLT